jgi:O-succinylbenzoic acid--CoA ligase
MKLASWLARSAATHPRRVALAGGGERLTYADLEVRVAGAARRLAGHGVGPGDRVVLAMDTSIDYAVLLHGLVSLEAVAVPLDPRLAPAELADRIGGVEPALVVRDPADVFDAPQGAKAGASLDRPIDLDAVHCVIHTSGSGGRARAVELTYGNHLWSALGSGARIGIDPRDLWLCCLPLHHVGGLAILMRSVVHGTGVLLERFDAGALASLISAERPTVASLVGTMLGRLLEAGAELDRLRCVLLGGGPVPPELIETAVRAGVPLAPTYGLTEAASQVTTLPPEELERKPGSAGTPILPCEVGIEEGLIMVRGANVAPGAAGEDGWLRTGDLGRIDGEGHLYVLGRADEVIVTGGENVSPEEVEQALIAHPAVDDAAVSAREDPEWQQAIVASVVLRDGAAVTVDELREFCRGRLAPFKVPKQITFAKRLPRNEQGKLERRNL